MINKEKLINLFSKNYVIILTILFAFAFILRLYFFNMNQAVWWDEASYLTRAKYYAGLLTTGEDIWSPRRPFLFPIIWAFLYKLGFTEFIIRLTELFLSIGSVALTYYAGKEIFGRKAGIIASFGMAVMNLHLFLTARLLMDLPAMTLILATVYVFYKYYINQDHPQKLWLIGLMLGLSLFTKATSVLIILPIVITIIIKEGKKFITNKSIYAIGSIAFLTLSPFLIYVMITLNKINIITSTTGIGGGRFVTLDQFISNITGALVSYTMTIPYELKIIFTIFFVIGLYIFLDLILGLDILIRKKDKTLMKKAFLLMWILSFLLFFGLFTRSYTEPRYILPLFPAVFIIMAIGILKVSDLIKNKSIAIIVVTIILILGGFSQISFADNLIKNKAYSMYHINPAGSWVKEHLNEDETVMVNSNQMEFLYYIEHNVHGSAATEEETIQSIKEKKPKYYIISIFYQFNPEWHYQLPEKYPGVFIPVQVYFLDQEKKQVVVAVYKIDYEILDKYQIM